MSPSLTGKDSVDDESQHVAGRQWKAGIARALVGFGPMSGHASRHRALMAELRSLARDLRHVPELAAQIGVLATARGLSCDALTRKGQRCRRTDLSENGRCPFHGGASTGPKTAEGKARARANLALRWATPRR